MEPTPKAEVQTAGGFFRLIEIDASETARYPDALDRLRAGDLHAVLVHGIYDSELLDGVVDRLERHDPPFLQTWFPDAFRSFFYGRNLNLAHPELEEYFDEAAEFDSQLDALFPTSLGLTDRISSVLSHLDHGRAFVAPPGPNPEQRYMFTTIRAHLEGGYIPPHCDNEQTVRPSYRHLASLIEPPLVSFVLALSKPEAGGALQVFNFKYEAPKAFLGDAGPPRPKTSELASVKIHLPPGSLILIDSGRYLHQVTPVVGRKKRWTVCSFMALSRGRDVMYCWG